MDLQGRVAIITGGSGGLGGASARRLAAEGAHVVIADLDTRAGEAIARETGGRFHRHDVTDEQGWAALVEFAREATGKVDILVNAAGIEGDLGQSGLGTSLAEWRRVLAVNLDGTFLGCRSVMPAMLEAGTGSIINISSIVSCMASPTALAYGASKAAVEQLTRSFALIGANDGKRVRCNSIHPGVIRTRMTENIIDELARLQGIPREASRAAIDGLAPLGRRGEPEEVADLALFLAGDRAAYITGSAFKVDGGWSLISAG